MASIHLKSRHWIVNENGKIIIGEGRKEIFENIERTGSINQTARIMKMSYKAVWSKIKATEIAMDAKLVETNRKQGSHLTQQGKYLLDAYTKMQKNCLKSDDKIFKTLFPSSDSN